MNQFRIFSQTTTLGFYNCCEVITAFVIDKKAKKTYNFFTIFSMEERENVIQNQEYLTSELLPLTKYHSLGVHKSVMSPEEAESCYNHLMESAGNGTCNIGCGDLSIGSMEVVPPVFVPQDSTVEIPMNQVLKNNFNNGSYVLEFFDTEKPVGKSLGKNAEKKACQLLFKHLPIDLLTISDRIGNILFQFPSLNMDISYSTDESEDHLLYRVKLDERLKGVKGLRLISEIMNDKTVVGFGTMEIDDTDCKQRLPVGDASYLCRTTVFDTQNQRILSRQDTTLMRHIIMRAHIGSQFGEERVLYHSDGTVKAVIPVTAGQTIRSGVQGEDKRREWIGNRSYRLRMEELERRKELLRYGAGQGSEQEKALKDLRELMNRGDGHRVYLWDPYLSAKDLLDTWYYTTTYGMELRAITSREPSDKEKDSGQVKDWIEDQRQTLKNGSNQYGIHLEFRCQWQGHGYGFHDRFLMIVDDKEKPQVWSLGASVNTVGKKHHIIQKVQDPQMIVDAFEELWEKLQVEECLIWKSGN